ncbi:hypothetical protein E2P81_ATG03536 [Venturia nashicola]|nr:hypothetical protein E2P81_ATG03536 [Venturia nashicola]
MRTRFSTVLLVFYTGQALAKTNHADIIADKEKADQLMFPGYTIYTPSWNFPINPGNGNATAAFNGTIEHAMVQMEEAYPGWRRRHDEHLHSTPLLKKRDEYWKRDKCCYHCDADDRLGWPQAKLTAIWEGIDYLKRQPGPGGIGNKGCGRISCSWDSGIWICNDHDGPLTLEDWRPVADGADFLCNLSFDCALWPKIVEEDPLCKGQAFHYCDNHDGPNMIPCPHKPWNVIVRGLKHDGTDEGGGYC